MEDAELQTNQCREFVKKKRSREQLMNRHVDDNTLHKKLKSEVLHRVPAKKSSRHHQIEPKFAKEHQTRSRTKGTASARLSS